MRIFRLAELIDLTAVQKLADSHFKVLGIPIGVIDAFDDSVLASAGWRDICTKYHRRHPLTLDRCQQHDRSISNWLHARLPKEYRCPNGMVDISMPIIVADQHIARISIGQFFTDDHLPERQFFIDQARECGFPMDEYLAALDQVPILSSEKVASIVDYDAVLAGFIADLAGRALQQIVADKKLRDSELRYRAVLQQASDGIYLLDPNTKKVEEANGAFLSLMGYTMAELREATIYDLVDADPAVIDEVLGEPTANYVGERRYRHRDGSLIDVEVSVSRVRVNERQNLCVIVRDITQSKQAQAERERLEARLQQAQKLESIGRLAGGIAHDFNNMLGVIYGYAEVGMKETAPGSRLHTSLEKIRQAAEYSANLTRQLLAFARKQVIKPRVVDPVMAIENSIRMLRRLVGEQVELLWHHELEIWPIRIDPVQVDQVLTNLCVNARDAIDSRGQITIELANVHWPAGIDSEIPAGDYILLAVSDNGHGMDEDTLAHVFEPFFTTKGVGEGTGLGLSTVYGIVSQNKGYIRANSELGQGTVFAIYLPRYHGEYKDTASSTPSIKAVSLPQGNETVLLVEDDPALLEIGSTMLRELGYTVFTAGRPNEGVRMAKEAKGNIDLLLTDVVMPQMTGPELAAQVTRSNPSCRVLYMSGYAAENITQRGVLDERIHFIQKPFSLRELGEEVRRVLATVP
jgi:PAS domain S-box-containing protein